MTHHRTRLARAALALAAVPLAAAAEGPPAPDPSLDAHAIYERVLANRFRSSVQELALRSGDRGGREAPVEARMLWRRYDEGTDERAGGVLSRTLIRYLEPYDVRGAGYLVVNKRDGPDDQFVYLPSMRRIRRVNLRGETVIGTDLSVEDIVPREMDDATYERGDDAEVQGRPCYVVDAVPVESSASRYSRFRLYVETEHFVPLRTRYWDTAGVEVKELRSPADSVRELDGVWIPLEGTMRQLLDGTYTTIRVVSIAPNARLPERYFSQRQLQARRLHLPDAVKRSAQRFGERTEGSD